MTSTLDYDSDGLHATSETLEVGPGQALVWSMEWDDHPDIGPRQLEWDDYRLTATENGAGDNAQGQRIEYGHDALGKLTTRRFVDPDHPELEDTFRWTYDTASG